MHHHATTIGICAHCQRPLLDSDRLRIETGQVFCPACRPVVIDRSGPPLRQVLALLLGILILAAAVTSCICANDRAARSIAFAQQHGYQ